MKEETKTEMPMYTQSKFHEGSPEGDWREFSL